MKHEIQQDLTRLLRSASWGALLAGVLLVAAALLTRSLSTSERLPSSLQWFDVAVVQISCTLPLAWWIGVWSGSIRRGFRTLFVAVALVIVAILAATGMTSPTEPWIAGSLALTALFVLASSLCVVSVVGFLNASASVPFSRFTAASLLMTALVVPATYQHARLQNELHWLTELLDQSRFGESLAVAGPIEKVDPRAVVNGRPIQEVVRALSQGVKTLEVQVRSQLPSNATDEIRLDRARTLAMLGRTGEALQMLSACRDPGVDGWLLAGTIRETRGEWNLGIEYYAAARTAIEKQPPGPSTTRQHIQATRGVAYCQRKAGRTRESEAAYRDLLVVSPTADAHFLAAQFYEDAQSTSLALQHAQQAMALDPQRYTEPGRKLIGKLQTVHFGCWAVYSGN